MTNLKKAQELRKEITEINQGLSKIAELLNTKKIENKDMRGIVGGLGYSSWW